MAISGPLVFMSTISLANYFPAYSGSVTGACVGAFDASSIVFPMLSAAMGPPLLLSFNDAFLFYGCIPLVLSLLVFLLYPLDIVTE